MTAFDLTTFVEGGANAGDHSSITASAVTLTNLAQSDIAWLAKDLGVDSIGDFEHRFEVTRTAGDSVLVVWGIGNTLGTYQDRLDVSDGFSIAVSTSNRFFLFDHTDASNDGPYTGSGSTKYYVTVIRSGTTLTATIRTGSHAGTTVDTLTLTVPTTAYRYLYAYASRDAASAATSSDLIENLSDETAVTLSDVAVTDANVFWSPYNWQSDGAGALQANNVKASSTHVVSNNPGAYLKAGFTGSDCSVTVDLSALTGASVAADEYPRLRYSIDGGAYTYRQLTAGDTNISLASGLSSGSHTLFLQIVGAYYTGEDRWTTPVMAVKITKLQIATGESTEAPVLHTGRAILFGDSHGEGYEAAGAGATVANQDAGLAWPSLVGDALGCEYGVIAFASQGYTTGSHASTNIPDLEDAWDFYSSGESRLVSGALSPSPDYVISAHGDNDSPGSAVTTACEALIAAWRVAAPSAQIVIVSNPDDDVTANLSTAVTNAADSNTTFVDLGPEFAEGRHLNGGHLSAEGQARFASGIVAGASATPATYPQITLLQASAIPG